MNESFVTYNDYWLLYEAESNLYDPAGSTSIFTSRSIDRDSVEHYNRERDTVEIISGKVEAFDSNVILFVSGGQVFRVASDETSGLNLAWRESHYAVISGLRISMTHVKGASAKKLALIPLAT